MMAGPTFGFPRDLSLRTTLSWQRLVLAVDFPLAEASQVELAHLLVPGDRRVADPAGVVLADFLAEPAYHRDNPYPDRKAVRNSQLHFRRTGVDHFQAKFHRRSRVDDSLPSHNEQCHRSCLDRFRKALLQSRTSSRFLNRPCARHNPLCHCRNRMWDEFPRRRARLIPINKPHSRTPARAASRLRQKGRSAYRLNALHSLIPCR